MAIYCAHLRSCRFPGVISGGLYCCSLRSYFILQITELVHQRDVTRSLIKSKIDNSKSFEWLSQMRFYFDPKQTDVLQQLSIQMANAKFNYGFEYLGVQDKLVQTPLTDRCYLTMTQALEARLGGSPFGKFVLKYNKNLRHVCKLLSSLINSFNVNMQNTFNQDIEEQNSLLREAVTVLGFAEPSCWGPSGISMLADYMGRQWYLK